MVEPVAPGMRRVGNFLRSTPSASVAKLNDEEVAKASGQGAPEFFANILMGRKPSRVATEDRDADGIPVRIYTPSGGSSTRPLIVYFHGGGFVFGDLRGGDWICGTVAKAVEATVVSVDYRLAPKHKFPAGVEDCFAGLKWAVAHAEQFGADPT